MRDVKAAMGLPKRSSFRLLRPFLGSVLVAVAMGTTGSFTLAQAQGSRGPGGPGGPGMMMLDGPPEQVGRRVDHMLDGLNATEVQRSQIRQIVTSAAADLKSQRDAGREQREKAIQIFTAPSVDASAAEALRQQMSAQQDQSSKRMLQAMLDVAKVLTPEQRARLGERMKARQAVMQDRMQRMQREHAPRGHNDPANAPAPQK